MYFNSIPQVVLAAVMTHNFSFNYYHIGGVVLIIVGSVIYAIIRYRARNEVPTEIPTVGDGR